MRSKFISIFKTRSRNIRVDMTLERDGTYPQGHSQAGFWRRRHFDFYLRDPLRCFWVEAAEKERRGRPPIAENQKLG
jgi:hypothetical protein